MTVVKSTDSKNVDYKLWQEVQSKVIQVFYLQLDLFLPLYNQTRVYKIAYSSSPFGWTIWIC